jgi:hypothetical protein
MTTFYLDTSVAMSESFLKSPFSDAFLKACAILQYAVVVPQIVIDELNGNFPKKLQAKLDTFNKAKKDLEKLIALNPQSISLSDSTAEFEDWLSEMLDDHGVVVAPYPDIPAKELIDQSYELKKPFKKSGEGHKDYLVWKTILRHLESAKETNNIFLTNNTNDFCQIDDEDLYILHSDLADQIENAAGKPKIYTSLKDAFEGEIAPNLEGLTPNDIPNLGENNLDSLVEKILLDDLPSRSLYGLEGVPFSNEITISSVGPHAIESVTLKKVDDDVIINVTGRVDVEIDGFMDKSEYYMSEHEGANVFVVDGNWNDHVMYVSSTVDTGFDMTIIYSLQSSQVTGSEVSLPQEIEDEWPYK